ncbi:hypothetical protein TNCV_3299211 [Trichonephila clavipes]|uniref:Uncharacterized protein n=1 Tax=Trichonephila clavipes TaxID=2585209 RepID=A0A8X7B7M9_TRICX|nr:hypothetical protein TNCV_3299211 [Trichonephila clavipes]
MPKDGVNNKEDLDKTVMCKRTRRTTLFYICSADSGCKRMKQTSFIVSKLTELDGIRVDTEKKKYLKITLIEKGFLLEHTEAKISQFVSNTRQDVYY